MAIRTGSVWFSYPPALTMNAGRPSARPSCRKTFRFDYFNGAHPYFQVEGHLAGNEAVRLTNVAKGRPVFEFQLPGVRPVFTVSSHPWPSGAPAPDTEAPLAIRQIIPKLDTLVLIPDEAVFFLVWRGLIPIRDPGALEVAEVRVEYEAFGARVSAEWLGR
ncbi:MAG: DUF2169 domain-containing protein [Polyangiaceae bacterium]